MCHSVFFLTSYAEDGTVTFKFEEMLPVGEVTWSKVGVFSVKILLVSETKNPWGKNLTTAWSNEQ